MKRSDIDECRGRGGRRRTLTLTALALLALPWAAFAFTTDHTTSLSISATVEPSLPLSHTPYTQALRADYPIPLSLSIESTDHPIRTAALFYRSANDPTFKSVPLQPPPNGKAGPYFGLAEIPASPPGVSVGASYDYYFNVEYMSGTFTLFTEWRPAGGGTATVSTIVQETQSVGTAGATVTLADGSSPSGGASRVVVPAGALPATSSVSLGLMASSQEQAALNVPVNGRFAVTGLSLQVKPNAVFQSPVSFSMSYKDQDNNGREDTTGADEALLQPAWFDGINWRALSRLGIDTARNVVTFNTSLTGYFALFPSNALPVSERPQEKIVSPNGDGINDAAFFDGLPAGSRIVIFDVRGRVVREISDAAVWDGRDSDGKVGESGLYVYQVRSNEGLRSGTITIAR